MNTLEFLQTVLSDAGTSYVVLFPADSHYKIHKSYDDLATMAAAIESFDRDPKYKAVYHACGGFKQPYIEVDNNRKQYRIPENWHRAKSFWMDIDCGADKASRGQGYVDKRAGCVAALKFAKEIGWPSPMLVDSGNGIHAYWPMTRSIKHEAWCKGSTILKSAAAHFGLLADPTATADFARILRPVGTMNRKNAANPKPVKVLKEGAVTEPNDLLHALLAVVKEQDIKVTRNSAKPIKAVEDVNSDLTGHLTQFPQLDSSGDLVADQCAQMAAMRDTGGDVNYEHWRGVIGVLVHCTDGRGLAESWSSERISTGHEQNDWQTRYDTWSSGPSTCEFFEKANAPGCAGCKHKGSVKSPIMLGRIFPAPTVEVVEIITEDLVAEETTVPAMPDGFAWVDNFLVRNSEDKDGMPKQIGFCRNLFYPTMRIKNDDGAYKVGIRMHLHNNRVRDFQMPFEAMASSTDLLRSLAKYELMQTNHKEAGVHLTAYLRDSLELLKRRVDETNTLVTFGWKDDMKGFLIGDRYYHRDGSVRQVLLGGYAANKNTAFPQPTGTLEGYAKPINYVYNRPGMECMQYALCSGWGSIFNVFCEELYCGLMVAITGGDSGKGKSTVAYASLYAFGDAKAMAMKSDEAGTKNALWATVGAFNNIPILFDELTKIEPEWLSTFTYTMSLGEEKARLQSTGSGVKFASQSTWRMSPFVTANKDLHGVLAASQANSQAEAVRLIQIHVDRYNIPLLEETEVQHALSQMQANRGVAGDALIKYAVTHTSEINERIRIKVGELVADVPGTKYRFYRNHAACTLVAAEIANELGIAAFDTVKLTKFSIGLMQDLANTISITNTVSAEDAFSRMISSLASGIMVTNEYRDSRAAQGVETPRNRITGDLIGRYVVGTQNYQEFAGRLFLCQKAVREWCMLNRLDYNNIIASLDSLGALLSADEKITLTKGTDFPRVQHRCIVVDLRKLDAAAPVLAVNNTPTTLAISKV